MTRRMRERECGERGARGARPATISAANSRASKRAFISTTLLPAFQHTRATQVATVDLISLRKTKLSSSLLDLDELDVEYEAERGGEKLA